MDIIREVIGPEKFDIWFKCAKPVSFENDELQIQLPTLYFKELYETRFYELV